MSNFSDLEECMQIFEEPLGYNKEEPQSTSHTYTRKREDVTPSKINFDLVGKHSLWAHVPWNAGILFADYIDENPCIVNDKRVLELGAGAALPSIVSSLNGASYVLSTDYPDLPLITQLKLNIHNNCVSNNIEAEGYLWGKNLLTSFDVIIMCDLIFNHSQHSQLLSTCQKYLVDDGVVFCVFSHHRPWMKEKDLNFFKLALDLGFVVKEMFSKKTKVMFENDPGSQEIRSTVHFYMMTKY
jgi:nicotinamide N-methyltransferase